MLKEYVSAARKLQIKGSLGALRNRALSTERNISDASEGFSKLVEHINILAPLCPPNSRSESHKVSYLRRSVTRYQVWSRFPIQIISFEECFYCNAYESITNRACVSHFQSKLGRADKRRHKQVMFVGEHTQVQRCDERNNSM